jgi:hypothetical protein
MPYRLALQTLPLAVRLKTTVLCPCQTEWPGSLLVGKPRSFVEGRAYFRRNIPAVCWPCYSRTVGTGTSLASVQSLFKVSRFQHLSHSSCVAATRSGYLLPNSALPRYSNV